MFLLLNVERGKIGWSEICSSKRSKSIYTLYTLYIIKVLRKDTTVFLCYIYWLISRSDALLEGRENLPSKQRINISFQFFFSFSPTLECDFAANDLLQFSHSCVKSSKQIFPIDVFTAWLHSHKLKLRHNLSSVGQRIRDWSCSAVQWLIIFLHSRTDTS